MASNVERNHNGVDEDVTNIHEGLIESEEYISDKVHNNESPDVNNNVIDNVEDVVHVVVEAKISKRTPKRSKRTNKKKKYILKRYSK